MNAAAELPVWAAILTSVLVVAGAAVTLIGSIGLLRLKSFYQRAHAPTLGTTLGIGLILFASMFYFSMTQERPVLHEILIAVLVFVTTPVTLLLLVRAALYRYRFEHTPGTAEPDDPFMDDSLPTTDPDAAPRP